jgi:hypothetical protein
MWLYAVMPFFGAVFAALLYLWHNALETDDRKDKKLPPSEYRKRREEHAAR